MGFQICAVKCAFQLIQCSLRWVSIWMLGKCFTDSGEPRWEIGKAWSRYHPDWRWNKCSPSQRRNPRADWEGNFSFWPHINHTDTVKMNDSQVMFGTVNTHLHCLLSQSSRVNWLHCNLSLLMSSLIAGFTHFGGSIRHLQGSEDPSHVRFRNQCCHRTHGMRCWCCRRGEIILCNLNQFYVWISSWMPIVAVNLSDFADMSILDFIRGGTLSPVVRWLAMAWPLHPVMDTCCLAIGYSRNQYLPFWCYGLVG